MVDLYRADDFIDSPARDRILTAMEEASGRAAPVYGDTSGGRVDVRARSSKQLVMPDDATEYVTARLVEHTRVLEERFGTASLYPEPPQFLRYEQGDFFVAHQDGNTGLIHDDSRFRRVSIIVFMNGPSSEPLPGTYEGGTLLLHEPYPNFDIHTPVVATPGTLIAFRSETTHEVTPVRRGQRYTIVSWYRVT